MGLQSLQREAGGASAPYQRPDERRFARSKGSEKLRLTNLHLVRCVSTAHGVRQCFVPESKTYKSCFQ